MDPSAKLFWTNLATDSTVVLSRCLLGELIQGMLSILIFVVKIIDKGNMGTAEITARSVLFSILNGGTAGSAGCISNIYKFMLSIC